MSLLLLLQFGFALHPYYGTGRGQAHRPKEYNYSRPFGGGEFRPFGRCPISPLLPLCRSEENWRAAANKWLTQRHREGSAHNPLPIPQEVRRLSCTESIPYRKEGCRVSISRRVVVLLAMVLVAATLATMSAASAFADELSDSQLRHKIDVIQNRPGPLTNQEENHIDNLKDRIHDNDDNDDDDDDDDDD